METVIPRADMPRFQAILMRIASGGAAKLGPNERAMLLSLAFAQAPAHQRFGLIDDALCAEIIAARKTFRDGFYVTDTRKAVGVTARILGGGAWLLVAAGFLAIGFVAVPVRSP